jgi:hypothetical protein
MLYYLRPKDLVILAWSQCCPFTSYKNVTSPKLPYFSKIYDHVVKENETGMVCGTYGGKDERILTSGGKARRKKITRKA